MSVGSRQVPQSQEPKPNYGVQDSNEGMEEKP